MIHKQIYKKIKKYDTIVIARHIGPDPDALGSSIGLKEAILATFPKKNVYVVGASAARFKYLGYMDKLPEELPEKTLLILTDTSIVKRIDGVDIKKFDYSIKIDHHPDGEQMCDVEWADDSASSASQMVIELIFKTKMKITNSAAEKLFVGLIADTNRFLYDYTSFKTFELIAELIKRTNINFTKLYPNIYMRPIKEIRFLGYLYNNVIITENGLGYIKLDKKTLEKFDVDCSTAGNLISNFEFVENVYVFAFCSEDTINNCIKVSIRSRGPIINDVAAKYYGGGHIYASGARPNDFAETDLLINDLDQVCKNYEVN